MYVILGFITKGDMVKIFVKLGTLQDERTHFFFPFLDVHCFNKKLELLSLSEKANVLFAALTAAYRVNGTRRSREFSTGMPKYSSRRVFRFFPLVFYLFLAGFLPVFIFYFYFDCFVFISGFLFFLFLF